MNNQQTTPNVPESRVDKASHKVKTIAIIILSVMVLVLAGLVIWLMFRSNSVNDAPSVNVGTTKSVLKTATIETLTGVKFSYSYPDTWTLSSNGYTTLTRSSDTTEKTTIQLSGSQPQSNGCSLLTSDQTIAYYDTAPIAGWSGNSYVSFYETDGKTWCFSAGLAATKDTPLQTGQTADKLYIQGASNHASIDTNASSGDQVYVFASRQFTSEDQAKQYVASKEYNEQKEIIRSLTVVK